MSLYLTQAALDRNAGAAALAPLLDPPDPDRALDAHHRLIWTLFPGRTATRDFLWRAQGSGRFLILSHRAPEQSDLFRPLETTEFAPVLAPGDRLSFALRTNATKDRRIAKDTDAQAHRPHRRVDIVMDALHGTPGQTALGPDQLSERPRLRLQAADRVASQWLAAQGARSGFALERLQVEDYFVRQLTRIGHDRVTFGVLDMTGTLTIREPRPFLAMLGAGLGRARAFGCGLMLIRRA